MHIRRAFPNVFAKEVTKTRDFYVSMFGWRVDFDSDWFVHLQNPENDSVELGIIRRDQEIVPEEFRRSPAGAMLTIVVDDVDALFALAQQNEVPIVESPRNLFYGQRRMLIRDPEGTLVDVSSDCSPSPEFLASLKQR